MSEVDNFDVIKAAVCSYDVTLLKLHENDNVPRSVPVLFVPIRLFLALPSFMRARQTVWAPVIEIPQTTFSLRPDGGETKRLGSQVLIKEGPYLVLESAPRPSAPTQASSLFPSLPLQCHVQEGFRARSCRCRLRRRSARGHQHAPPWRWRLRRPHQGAE